MASRKEMAEAALRSPNMVKYLKFIAAAEGTKHGYRTGFGNTVIESLDQHPRESKEFTTTDGKVKKTTAAGAYQFLASTYDDVAGKMGLSDFSPHSQDLAAVELIRRAGALSDVLSGDFKKAIKKTGKTWASLPSSPYKQGKRTDEWVSDYWKDNGQAPSRDTADLVKRMDTVMAAPPALAEIQQPMPAQPAMMEGGGLPARSPSEPGGGLSAFLPDEAPLGSGFGPDPDPEASWQERLGGHMQDAGGLVQSDQDREEWENKLMAQSMGRDLDAARHSAVSSIVGEQDVPQIQLPVSLERRINQILAKLNG